MGDARDGRMTSRVTVDRLAMNKTEAAQALGVSVDFFDDHVAHELRCVRRGRRRLYPVTELQRWLDKSAERTVLGLGIFATIHCRCQGHEFWQHLMPCFPL